MKKEKIDIHGKTSKKTGLAGFFEVFIRSFNTLAFIIFLIPVLFIFVFAVTISLCPSVSLVMYAFEATEGFSFFIRSFLISLSFGFGFYLCAVVMVFSIPLVNLPFLPFVKPARGNWYSASTVPWYIHNGLTYIMRYTFLDLLIPTPLSTLFFKLMGMKIGKGTVINSSNISDPCLIELGDYVTIGGSAHLMAHYGQKGILIIAKTIIKNKATVGLKASVFGDVVIGEEAFVAPHSVVLPKSRIEAKEKFGLSN